jgi:hypothetical protein
VRGTRSHAAVRRSLLEILRACNKTPFGNCRMGVFWRIGKHWATTQDQSPKAAMHADTAKPSWFESQTARHLVYTPFTPVTVSGALVSHVSLFGLSEEST